MFERYTESARSALFFARYETTELGGEEIEPDHLLLGLLRGGSSISEWLFARANLTYDDARREIEARRGVRARHDTSIEIPFSSRTRRVLEYAAEEADRLAHTYIGTEHLLLGLLREEGPAAESPMQARRMRLEDVRDEIVRLLGESSRSEERQEAPDSSRTREAMFGAVSANALESYYARDLSERVARIEQLLMQLASASEDNPRALEVISAIQIELASMKLPPD